MGVSKISVSSSLKLLGMSLFLQLFSYLPENSFYTYLRKSKHLSVSILALQQPYILI